MISFWHFGFAKQPLVCWREGGAIHGYHFRPMGLELAQCQLGRAWKALIAMGKNYQWWNHHLITLSLWHSHREHFPGYNPNGGSFLGMYTLGSHPGTLYLVMGIQPGWKEWSFLTSSSPFFSLFPSTELGTLFVLKIELLKESALKREAGCTAINELVTSKHLLCVLHCASYVCKIRSTL
jgi:hypothetical protein